MERKATCCCGQLVVACQGEPVIVAVCHCPSCQRRTGSTYGVAAFFSRADVQSQGRTRHYTRPSDSGSEVTFHFCPDCGSSVLWEPGRRPDLIAVAVGAFADPTFPAPSQQVFEQYRHHWVKISNQDT